MEDRLTIGEVAQLYHVSTRTLRLYHDNGLFIPSEIDKMTGYRYYVPSQFARLDMILRMRAIGLPLKQIIQMLKIKDMSAFEILLGEQIELLERKIIELTASKITLARQLSGCKYLLNPPVLDSIFVDFIPKRDAYYFDIKRYDMGSRDTIGTASWMDALDTVKVGLVKNNVPILCFQQVGCMISREDLEKGKLICSGAFICANQGNVYNAVPHTIESGAYVCMYDKWEAGDNSSEGPRIRRMLQYIADHNYRIAGPYLGEVIAESSVFDYDRSDIIIKMQIPIHSYTDSKNH